MAQRRSSQQSISNLSVSFIESAFLTLADESLRVYRHNIDRKRPPVAQGENVPAAAAIMPLATGLGYHLCRLKYLRDFAKHTPPLPHTPYFQWSFDENLATKLQNLLFRPKESRLLAQLIEVTVCRDAIVHPKLHTITHSWGAEFSNGSMRAKLPVGITHRQKTIKHKMQRGEFSKLLKLPLVSTWVSYVDAVMCVLAVYRFLTLVERRYGNPYGQIGGITAYEDQTKGLFTGWNWKRSQPRDLVDWARAFFLSLSAMDQVKVERRLGGNIKLYTEQKVRSVRMKTTRKRSLGMIFLERNPPKQDFLSKPPAWLTNAR